MFNQNIIIIIKRDAFLLNTSMTLFRHVFFFGHVFVTPLRDVFRRIVHSKSTKMSIISSPKEPAKKSSGLVTL